MKSGPDTSDESRFTITFFSILVIILCRFRIALEGKTNEEIPESSRLVSAK